MSERDCRTQSPLAPAGDRPPSVWSPARLNGRTIRDRRHRRHRAIRRQGPNRESQGACAGSVGALGRVQAFEPAREQVREPRRPSGLASGGGDEVLAYLELDMDEAAPLAVHGDGVVALVVDRIGLVVADAPVAVAGEEIEERTGETAVAVVEDAQVPRPRVAVVDRGEAVHGDEDACLPLRRAAIERARDGVVMGLEDLARPRPCPGRVEVAVAGDGGVLAERGDRIGNAGRGLEPTRPVIGRPPTAIVGHR